MSTDAPPSTAPERTWSSELDRFERELAQVERQLTDPASWNDEEAGAPWQEPRALGPIPAELAGRARDLLRRQQLAAEGLAAALGGVDRQQRYATHVNRSRQAPQAPAYLDVSA